MIQLEFVNKDDNTRKRIVKSYYDELARKSKKIDELNCWCDKNLDMKSLIRTKYNKEVRSFEKVVTADLKTLIRIKDYINLYKVAPMNPELKKYIIDTMYKNYIKRVKFINELGVTVCPYCNRNFINSNGKVTNCQFDHFINKSKYPILAVSFYNLVPVCPSCNHTKSVKDFSYSPYDDTVTTDQIITFSYSIKGVNYLSDNSKLEIVLNLGRNEILKNNIEILGLYDLYQIHTDRVQELIKKKEIYTDEYIQQLYNQFGDLFKSVENIEQLITGVYTSSDNYGKRPLSKMITDISKELGLIRRYKE